MSDAIGIYISPIYTQINEPGDNVIIPLCNVGITMGKQKWLARGVDAWAVTRQTDAVRLFEQRPELFQEYDSEEESK